MSGLFANSISFVLWWLLDAWIEGDWRWVLNVWDTLLLLIISTFPFLVLGIWSLIQELSLEELAREKLRVTSAFTALLVTIWLPALLTIMPPHSEGKGDGVEVHCYFF